MVQSLHKQIQSLNQQISLMSKTSLHTCLIEPIYFNSQVICKSLQDRDIHLLTISSIDLISHHREVVENEHFQINQSLEFQKIKPIIFITCRVHPGENSSSLTLQGFLNFVLDQQDTRACLLRKHFVFKIIPMINPDGVHMGLYRFDSLGQNLNRYYK